MRYFYLKIILVILLKKLKLFTIIYLFLSFLSIILLQAVPEVPSSSSDLLSQVTLESIFSYSDEDFNFRFMKYTLNLSFQIFVNNCIIFSSEKGSLSVIAQNITTPRLQTSANQPTYPLLSVLFSFRHSGAINQKVPKFLRINIKLKKTFSALQF